jgi:hypothetical protein
MVWTSAPWYMEIVVTFLVSHSTWEHKQHYCDVRQHCHSVVFIILSYKKIKEAYEIFLCVCPCVCVSPLSADSWNTGARREYHYKAIETCVTYGVIPESQSSAFRESPFRRSWLGNGLVINFMLGHRENTTSSSSSVISLLSVCDCIYGPPVVGRQRLVSTFPW